MGNKVEKFDLHQSMMNEVYDKWRTSECKGMVRLEVVNNFFTKAHKVAVQLGNLNYQVHNGGFAQWFDNGYGVEDLEDLCEYFSYAKSKNIPHSKEVLDILNKLEINVSCPDCNGEGRIECSECCGVTYFDCEECDGSGYMECSCYGEDESCSECDGSGEINCDECDGSGEKQCSECDGYGYVECEECGGNGELICNWNDLDDLDDKFFKINEDDLLSMYEEMIRLYM